MQASGRFNYEGETRALPLDELLDYGQIPHYEDDESSEDEITTDHSSTISDCPQPRIVYCRWDNCRKIFRAGTYLCIDVKLFMEHIKRDHIDPMHLEDGEIVQCLWGSNESHDGVAREEILEHVEEHFRKDEDTIDAYADVTLTPKQWVYCLWRDCGKMFVDQDVEDIWAYHIWDHIEEDYAQADETAMIQCEWKGCEDDLEDPEECESTTIAEHVKKHLTDDMRYT